MVRVAEPLLRRHDAHAILQHRRLLSQPSVYILCGRKAMTLDLQSRQDAVAAGASCIKNVILFARGTWINFFVGVFR